MKSRIEQTLDYLKETFDKSSYFADNPVEKEYRLRHSIRVANIGAEIAAEMAMDVEAMTIACLLHDISYANAFQSHDDWKNHGRQAAKMSRDFLEQLKLPKETIEAITYGIAIHVDDEADFEGERTLFALTIGDADNIDRFDVYRIYENLQNDHFSGLSHNEQLSYLDKKLDRLKTLESFEFGTPKASQMWLSLLGYQTEFFIKLKRQLKSGESLTHFL